ncbi:MAG: heme ABC exporter ATP-binding protein CcmA [Proteobacteria bacterium]|nr:heme ABC exporter ATP-binding protein CcmA [Pseudomonadota bacterium]
MQLVSENLACERGGRRVFADVNFAVSAGEAMIVTGRNGSGKSTLLRVIAGLLRAAAGRVGLSGGPDEASLAEQAHYLGHLDATKPSLTVAENLQFWARFLGAPADVPVAPALDAVELGSLADLPAAYLSAGQKRRLSIARLLAVKRQLWLLDEPTSALDTQSQGRLAAFMREHLAGGGMIVAATHGPIGLNAPRELKMGLGG